MMVKFPDIGNGLKMKIVVVFILVCCLECVVSAPVQSDVLQISTFNMWNVMFNWPIRKFGLIQMLTKINPDIIAFQEVRADVRTGENQINEIQKLLPRYKWSYFHPINDIIPMKNTYLTGWEREGIGFLSQYPVIKTKIKRLAYHDGPDKNKREILHAQLGLGHGRSIDLIVVHLSYDRQQQCGNTVEIMQYIQENSLKNAIVVGDFNTYNHFEWPVQVLTLPDITPDNKCYRSARLVKRSEEFVLQDTWKDIHIVQPGFTFSNMPNPGLESRPDRILASKQFRPVNSKLTGNGTQYKALYSSHIIWNRMRNVLYAGYETYLGFKGRSCRYDCGPNASCRCGICVSGGDKNICNAPDCPECSEKIYRIFLVYTAAWTLIFVIFLYSVFRLVYILNKRHPDSEDCCICNPELYNTVRIRRSNIKCLLRIFPCLKLPPFFLFIFGLFSLFTLLIIGSHLFKEPLSIIYKVIPEEYFPSDHLMLTVSLAFDS
ncbi:unnamed protein product [Owenia fusiformis]|uniref:Endonuclease/exonuclease/phosphatase domain-containing protein n=1 Tax=Owenia fusiformis TaxID=6347 RepID=A0A8J1T6M7_OWEFU|nr:unnamed protein product [Owenia fusiformis]